MIQQPELGKRISDLRKEKGLTQEELVEKCNLSVRTLQRIEAGEVIPRPVTVRLIFKALEVSFDKTMKNKGLMLKWPGQFNISFTDLFNLKTNTMKKVSVLSVTLIAAGLGLFLICSDSRGQTHDDVQQLLNGKNKKLVHWFNNGMTDSIVGLYSKSACILANGAPNICGKEELSVYYKTQCSMGYKFIDVILETVNVADTIAIERGIWIVQIDPETRYKGKYLTEWHYTNGSWLIINDIGCPETQLSGQ
jgi:DNA-binding XRE family transcriptional regulator